VIGLWIAETQAKDVTAQAEIRAVTGQPRMRQNFRAVTCFPRLLAHGERSAALSPTVTAGRAGHALDPPI
jgi:hypothetical protein